MAKDKKPSIFADRGTIGSSDELDEYGVWVKSEPQDLSQAFSEADGFSTEMPDTDNLDSAIPDLEDLPDFDTFGAVSQDSDVSLNIPEDDYELPDFETNDKTTEEDNDSDVFNFGELAEPVDLDSGELDSAGLGSVELDSAEPDPEDDEGFKEISMDEFVGTQNSTDSLGFDDSLESTDSLESDEPIEIDADIESVITEAPVLSAEKETAKETQPLDLSTQLLMKIAEELSSIRNELSTLKREFSGLRAAAPQAEDKEKDFLGEEDDEKISLTGDELNNILNTADFTEEAGSDAAIGLSENEDDSDELSLSTADLDMEIDLTDSDLEGLEGETKLENSSFDEAADEDNQISPEIEMPDDSIVDFSSVETDELNEILESGVEPMTFAPAPEDTNYLIEDPLVENAGSEDFLSGLAEETAGEPFDLSGAVIDEPDLSLEIQDNPLEEPSLEDISISLDMSELDSVELGSEELESIEFESVEDDIALPLSEDVLQDGEDLSIMEEGIPEGFVVEEDDYSEVSGKEESLEEIAEEIEEIQEVIEEVEEFLPEFEESAAVIPETVLDKGTSSPEEVSGIPANLKTELKTVLSYMDQLLEALPDEKIEEFAKSDYYDTYKKLFKELGLV
jgi:Asp-tRNA(Asn)/Glu-tRNA(Gln) amidotransferase C subunit